MRAYEFLKDDSELPDLGKDTWSGGGSEFSPDWTQQIGVDAGQGYQRASGNLPGGLNLSIAADEPSSTTFMPQKGVNISKGPASLYLGDRGAVSGSYNIPLDDKSSVSLSASGQKDQGLTGVGAQYQRGNFSAGVNQPNFPGAKPQFNVGYSAQFEEAELEEMAGKVHGDISKALKEKGYKYLDGGIDKHVFLEPSTGYAFIVFGYRPEHKKGFSPDQRMFADWVRYCKKNSNNPHLPRFSGMESFNFQGKTYIQCRMEHLKEAPKRIGPVLHFIADYADTLGGRINYEDVITDMLDAEGIDYSVEQVVEYLGGPESAAMLIDTVNTVMQFGMNHGFNIDLHAGNYMQRADGTIVVNDPFVVWLYASGPFVV